jgi:hypothetical protein
MQHPRLIRPAQFHLLTSRADAPAEFGKNNEHDQEFVDRLADMLDDSARFVCEELVRGGLVRSELHPTIERLNCGLLSVWVEELINLDVQLQESRFAHKRRESVLDEFFKRRFNRKLQTCLNP